MENKSNSGSKSNDGSSFDFSDIEEPERVGEISRKGTTKLVENDKIKEKKNLKETQEKKEKKPSGVKLPPIELSLKKFKEDEEEKSESKKKKEKKFVESHTNETNSKSSQNNSRKVDDQDKKLEKPKKRNQENRNDRNIENQRRHRDPSQYQRNSRSPSPNQKKKKPKKEEEKEEKIRIFIEKDSHTSFCQFLSSEFASKKRKCYIWITVLAFLLISLTSIYELVMYFASDCKDKLGFGFVLIFYYIIIMTLKFSFYIFMLLEIYGNIEYLVKIPHLIPLGSLLMSPAFFLSLYTYDFKGCQEANNIFTKKSSFTFSMRIFYGILIYCVIRILTSMINPLLKASKKKSVQSFRRAWYSVLSLVIYFFMICMMILSIVIIFTQKIGKSLGLTIDAIILIFYIIMSFILSYFQNCKKILLFEMIPIKDEDSDEDQTVLKLQPADMQNVREMKD